jgi:uncharacterized protein (DUF1778 family)
MIEKLYVYQDKRRISMRARSTMKKSTLLRSRRIELRVSREQATLLGLAAEARHKSLTDFILDSACAASEQALLEQRLFMVSGQDYRTLMDMLNGPAKRNPGLRKLFSKPGPWK